MTHFHLAFGDIYQNVYAQAFYSDYEESIVDFSEFATMFYGNHTDEQALGFHNALLATRHGLAFSAMVGEGPLCIYWLRCERCHPPSLN